MQDLSSCCACIGSASKLGGVDWEDEVGGDVFLFLEDGCVALYTLH